MPPVASATIAATHTTASTRRDWALLWRERWRIFHVVVPGGVAYTVLRALDLVAETPLWAYVVALLGAHFVSQIAAVLFPPQADSRSAWARTFLCVASSTIPIYMTGLGAMLAVGFVTIAADQVRTDGARAALPVYVWSVLAIGVGELFVAADVAPSLLSEEREHGLAVLMVIVMGPAILLFGNVAGERERTEETSSRLLDLAHVLAEAGTRREVSQRLADAVPHVLGLDRAVVALRDSDMFHVAGIHGFPEALAAELRTMTLSTTASPFVVDHVITHPRITLLDASVDDPLIGGRFERFGAVEAYAAPVVAGGNVIAFIVADRTQGRPHGLSPVLRQRLGGLADQAAIALENGRLIEQERGVIEQLREADELKTEFLAVVSHELRTPLSVMLGAARTLQWRGTELADSTRGDLVESIVRRGEQLNRLVEDLLQASGAMQLELAPTDLAAVVRTAVADSQTLYPDTDVTCSVPEEPVIVRADAFRVRQVVDNLVENAHKYATGCAVDVSVAWDGDDAVITVADAGPGMTQSAAEHAFDAFYQGDSSAVRRVGGLGLGLHICRRIADAHGGRITLDSAPGAGTRVRVWLPATGPAR